jgi:acid stress-induced BolA-like protein IbaG/YrbA
MNSVLYEYKHNHMTLNFNVNEHIEKCIIKKVPDAQVTMKNGSHEHFSLCVFTAEFQGKSMLTKNKLVLSAIAPFMSENNLPVHAIDNLETQLPTL